MRSSAATVSAAAEGEEEEEGTGAAFIPASTPGKPSGAASIAASSSYVVAHNPVTPREELSAATAAAASGGRSRSSSSVIASSYQGHVSPVTQRQPQQQTQQPQNLRHTPTTSSQLPSLKFPGALIQHLLFLPPPPPPRPSVAVSTSIKARSRSPTATAPASSAAVPSTLTSSSKTPLSVQKQQRQPQEGGGWKVTDFRNSTVASDSPATIVDERGFELVTGQPSARPPAFSERDFLPPALATTAAATSAIAASATQPPHASTGISSGGAGERRGATSGIVVAATTTAHNNAVFLPQEAVSLRHLAQGSSQLAVSCNRAYSLTPSASPSSPLSTTLTAQLVPPTPATPLPSSYLRPHVPPSLQPPPSRSLIPPHERPAAAAAAVVVVAAGTPSRRGAMTAAAPAADTPTPAATSATTHVMDRGEVTRRDRSAVGINVAELHPSSSMVIHRGALPSEQLPLPSTESMLREEDSAQWRPHNDVTDYLYAVGEDADTSIAISAAGGPRTTVLDVLSRAHIHVPPRITPRDRSRSSERDRVSATITAVNELRRDVTSGGASLQVAAVNTPVAATSFPRVPPLLPTYGPSHVAYDTATTAAVNHFTSPPVLPPHMRPLSFKAYLQY